MPMNIVSDLKRDGQRNFVHGARVVGEPELCLHLQHVILFPPVRGLLTDLMRHAWAEDSTGQRSEVSWRIWCDMPV